MLSYFRLFRFIKKSLDAGFNHIVIVFNEDRTYHAKATRTNPTDDKIRKEKIE